MAYENKKTQTSALASLMLKIHHEEERIRNMNTENKLAGLIIAFAIGVTGIYAWGNCGSCAGDKAEGCKEKVCPIEKKADGCKDGVCPAGKKSDKACCTNEVKKAEAKSEPKGE